MLEAQMRNNSNVVAPPITSLEPIIDQQELSSGGQYGFKGRMFPLFGAIIGISTVTLSYYVARQNGDVQPFPKTDITHTGIKFPQYAIMRIGLMVCAPILTIAFMILKNYLDVISFELTGHPAQSVGGFNWLGIISCFSLAISTACMSDGGDMNWTLHVYCASQFFIITILMIVLASIEYRRLWPIKRHFCKQWSYQIKKYANFIVIALVLLQLLEILKVIEIYSLVQWLATFFVMAFMITLYWDFDKMDILLIKNRQTQQ